MKKMIPILVLCLSFSVHAQWSGDPTVNNPICTATGKQIRPLLVSDGAGGAIFTWWDYRGGTTSDIYAQRINAAGVLQWTANGVAICTATNDQDYVKLVSDGAGGAIITWRDARGATSDIYAQRINTAGVVQWTANGVAICTDLGYQSPPFITSDSAHGAIIAWFDERNRIGRGDVYCQRISAAGGVLWTVNGVAVCMDSTNQGGNLVITSDGASGAIMAWGDNRNGGNTSDIFSARISAAGTVQWTANGVAICTATDTQVPASITSDGANGAIIAWGDRRRGGIVDFDVYSQRITAAGAVQWTANGVAICTAPNGQTRSPGIISDGANGAIIVWSDKRFAYYNGNIYSQRISAAGLAQWTADGVGICTDSSDQIAPIITSDGASGAIIAWRDFRNGSNNYDIYSQRINAAGVGQWTANGVAIRTLPSVQYLFDITSDDANGAILAYEDHRNGGPSNADIYAQRVRGNGVLGGTTDVTELRSAIPKSFALEQNYPNPFNPTTKIRFTLSSQERDGVWSFVSLKVYDVLGREVATLVNENLRAGNYATTFDASRTNGGQATGLASGIYYYRLQSGSYTQTKKMVLIR